MKPRRRRTLGNNPEAIPVPEDRSEIMNKRTGKCTVEVFWAEVAHFGWGTKTTDCDAIKRDILERWDDEFTEGFREHCDAFEHALYEKVERYERANDVSCECGDDGFGDLLSHMVGLGKEYFEACMADPSIVVERGQRSDYVEKFSYGIPYTAEAPEETLEEAMAQARARAERCRHPDEEEATEDEILMRAYSRLLGDRAEVEPRYYGAWARVNARELEALMDSEWGDQFGGDLVMVVSAFADVAKNEPEHMLKVSKKVHEALDRIEEKRHEIIAAEEARLKKLRSLSHASCENLVGDIEKNFGGDREEAC